MELENASKMEKITYGHYQKIIRKGAWDKFSTKHGILDIIISLCVIVFVGFIWFFVFKRGDDSVLTALAVLVVFFLIYSIVYLGYFAREHAIIYNEQKNKIEKFEKEKINLKALMLMLKMEKYTQYMIKMKSLWIKQFCQ